MSEDKHDELNDLYKKSSITLQLVGGLVLVGILANIHEIYRLIPSEYSGGIFVVFTIGLSKYFDLILGNNNAIIFNSKYYRMVLFLGLLLAVLAITLNVYFIPRYGIDGAAIATLISVTLYCCAKLLFVIFKMRLNPFTKQTLQSLGVLALTFVTFYFWEFPFYPLVNIVLKSALVALVYVGLHFLFKISPDVNLIIINIARKARLF